MYSARPRTAAVPPFEPLEKLFRKQIGEMSAVLCGEVDAILLTGGLMRFQDLSDFIRQHCGWIAPITIYPGEMEQQALALSALKVMRGEIKARDYTGKPVWNGFPGIEF